jgi:hypothetical protein
VSIHIGKRGAAILTSIMVLLAVGACAKQNGGTGTLSGVGPTQAPSPTASAIPKQYFADGKSYQAWIIGSTSGPTLTIDLAHHLVDSSSASPASQYLIDHSASPGPDGIPNDYIDVDTHVHKTLSLSSSAVITINPDGAGPRSMAVDEFLSWLTTNAASPVPQHSPEDYFGEPTFAGPLFEVKFKKDAIVYLNQIFEP